MSDPTGPACKSDISFNFAKASGLDDFVYGAARPGAVQQRCFDEKDKVTDAEVLDWAKFMKEHGMQRVIGLLTPSEIETYDHPPLDVLRPHFNAVNNVHVKAPGAVSELVSLLEEAEKANEKVVVHCWGGGGRTGQAVAAWLVRRHGVTTQQAAEEVLKAAQEAGASRRVDVAALEKFVG